MPRPNVPRDTRQKSSVWKNDATYIQYFDRLTELAISMFEWKNLPKGIDERFLELTLFNKGYAVFYKDTDLDQFIALPCAIGGTLNIYNIPTQRRAYAASGYRYPCDETNSVLIYNNMLHKNSVLDVEMFAKRLYEMDRIIDVNISAQKTPILLSCDENQRLTLKNLYMQYDGNVPVIYGEKYITPDSIKAINTQAPFIADKIYDIKTQRWNEMLTYLGITNLNVQKKERLIRDEVMRQTGGTIASRYSRLNARRKACEEINEMFGLELDCVYREDYREVDDEIMIAGETGERDLDPMVNDLRTKEGGAYEQVYHRSSVSV